MPAAGRSPATFDGRCSQEECELRDDQRGARELGILVFHSDLWQRRGFYTLRIPARLKEWKGLDGRSAECHNTTSPNCGPAPLLGVADDSRVMEQGSGVDRLRDGNRAPRRHVPRLPGNPLGRLWNGLPARLARGDELCCWQNGAEQELPGMFLQISVIGIRKITFSIWLFLHLQKAKVTLPVTGNKTIAVNIISGGHLMKLSSWLD